MLQLKIVKGPAGVGQFFSLAQGRSITLGRSEQCELRLPSAGVSKTHCRMTGVSGSKAIIEDLGSSNGTFVNGLLIKKHHLRPGDSISIAEYVFAVGIDAPKVPATQELNPGFEVPPQGDVLHSSPQNTSSLAQKTSLWINANVFPWADQLSARFNLRILVGAFFFVWSIILVVMTVSPFAAEANRRVREESIEVAKLYARQLVRLNQQAIIDSNYRDLISELDSRRGKTPGILSSLIIDAKKAQILAPVESMGQNLPNNYSYIATTKDSELVQIDEQGVAHVSAPILIATPQGVNETVATAYVEFDPIRGQFSFASLLDRALSSLLYSVLLSLLLFAFLYRWIEGSLQTLGHRIEEAIRQSSSDIQIPIQWGALQQLITIITSLLARSQSSSAQYGDGPNNQVDWATSTVNAGRTAAAAFDQSLTVLAWNSNMERMIGIRAAMAIGNDISSASRDVSFETAIRTLAQQISHTEWAHASQRIELSGIYYSLSMIHGQGAYLTFIEPEDQE